MVGVQQARFRWPEPLFGELQDLPNDAAARRKSADLIADTQWRTRARRLTIDAHVVGVAGALGQRARLEQSRGTQEAVEPHRLGQTRTTLRNRELTRRAARLRLQEDHVGRCRAGRLRWCNLCRGNWRGRNWRLRSRWWGRSRRRGRERLGPIEDGREAALNRRGRLARGRRVDALGSRWGARWIRVAAHARDVARQRSTEQGVRWVHGGWPSEHRRFIRERQSR